MLPSQGFRFIGCPICKTDSVVSGPPASGERDLPRYCKGDCQSVQGGRVSVHWSWEGGEDDLLYQVPGALQRHSAKDHETWARGSDHAPGVRVHA